MKKLFAYIIWVLLAGIQVHAQDLQEISGYCGKDGENIKWTVNTVAGTLVFEGSGEMASYNYVGEQPWMAYKSSITTISVGEGITSITNNSFANMSFGSITLPTSLESLGTFVFQNCKQLKQIDLPINLASIGGSAFAGSSIESIKIPYAIKAIPSSLCLGCDKLIKVEVTNDLTDIGDYAFYGCSSLSSITLPTSLTSIGSNAFSDCANLTEVILPVNLGSIGNGAFQKTGLLSITIPASISQLENSTFDSCENLAVVNLNDGLSSIGRNCFRGCTSLKTISLPTSLSRLNVFAFSGCTALEVVKVEGSNTYLGDYAFSGCTSLTNVVLPEGFSDTCLGEGVFGGCDALAPLYNPTTFFYMPNNGVESYTIPEGITTIAKNAFSGNKSIKNLYLPSSIAYFSSGAFASSSIEELDLSNIEYLSLGAGVFKNSAIRNFISPQKISNCPQYAFENCKNLIELDLSGIRQIPDVTYFGNLGIGDGAFRGCENLTKVILPVTVGRLDIGQEAFKNCISLETIDLSPVGTFYMRAFENCKKLKKIEISDFGTSQIGTFIYNNAFSGCESLDSLVIGSSGLQNFPMSAFEGCSGLKSVVITGENVPKVTDFYQSPYNGLWDQSFSDFNLPFDTTVFTMFGYLADNLVGEYGEGSFWSRVHYNKIYETLSGECGDMGDNIKWSLDTKEGVLRLEGSGHMKLPEDTDLLTWKDRKLAVREIVLPDSLVTICPYAFSGCAVRTIKLNKYLRSIGKSAFNGCKLESIQFNDSLKNIGETAFEGCSSLNRIELNDGVESIGKCAFRYCKSLEEAMLPATVVNMDEGAFVDCSFLKSITLPKNLKTVPGYTLSGCSRLEKVVMPYDVQSLGANAFSRCSNLVDIYCPAVLPPSTTGYGNDQIRRSNITMHIPEGTTEAYKSRPLWGLYQMDEYYAYVGIQNYGGGRIAIEGDTIAIGKWNGYFVLGESFAFCAIPDDYSYVKSITVNDSESISLLIDNVISFDVLQESKDITVMFAPCEYTLNLSVLGRGHILLRGHDVEESGKFTVTHNDCIEMEFSSNEGYKIDSILVDGTNVANMLVNGKYTVEYPTKDIRVEAIFGKDSYKLTYMIGDEIYKETDYEFEAVITPEPVPEGDYKHFEWIGLPETMPAHDVVVTASYETGIFEVLMANPYKLRIYTPDGKLLDKPQKGINIIIMDNGESKKILVK